MNITPFKYEDRKNFLGQDQSVHFTKIWSIFYDRLLASESTYIWFFLEESLYILMGEEFIH